MNFRHCLCFKQEIKGSPWCQLLQQMVGVASIINNTNRLSQGGSGLLSTCVRLPTIFVQLGYYISTPLTDDYYFCLWRTPQTQPSKLEVLRENHSLQHLISKCFLSHWYSTLPLCRTNWGIFYLFTYFWLCWVLDATRVFLQLQRAGATLQLWSRGFSMQWLLLLWSTGSRAQWASVAANPGLQGTDSVVAAPGHSMQDLPGPEIEPVSPALAGKFFTTEPPGEPHVGNFLKLRCLAPTPRNSDSIGQRCDLGRKKTCEV